MRVLAQIILALCIVLSGATAAAAQADKDKYNLKPLIPPVIILPPNALVTPGSGSAPLGNQPPPLTGNFSTQPDSPGLKITIPR